MGCRCSSIRRCRSDLRRLAQGLRSIQEASGQVMEIEALLSRISRSFSDGVYLENGAEMDAALIHFADPMAEKLETMERKIRSADSSVESRKRRYEAEDERYHSEP